MSGKPAGGGCVAACFEGRPVPKIQRRETGSKYQHTAKSRYHAVNVSIQLADRVEAEYA